VLELDFRAVKFCSSLEYICTLIYKECQNNEKCNDEIYQLAKDQALVKKLKNNKNLGLFVYALRM
jgi:hypothetical protein